MATNSQLSTADWPAIACLCPTYGRFERLRDVVACFLLQDYGPQHAAEEGVVTLLVLNDAPVPIRLAAGGAVQDIQASPEDSRQELSISASRRVVVINQPERFASLGQKRQWLLEAARTELVAHWDDDDIYLPWHLSQTVEALLAHPVATCAKPSPSCVKAQAAWFITGPRQGPFQCRGIHHNVFEGQMVFRRDRALKLGGYPALDSGQAKALLDAFRREGELHEWDPADADVSYVYRWGDGADHVSARRAQTRDADFGRGEPLVSGEDPLVWARERLSRQFEGILRGLRPYLSVEDWGRMSARLLAA